MFVPQRSLCHRSRWNALALYSIFHDHAPGCSCIVNFRSPISCHFVSCLRDSLSFKDVSFLPKFLTLHKFGKTPFFFYIFLKHCRETTGKFVNVYNKCFSLRVVLKENLFIPFLTNWIFVNRQANIVWVTCTCNSFGCCSIIKMLYVSFC